MLLAKTFHQPTGQPIFEQVTMPISPLKQPPPSVVTSERPFVQLSSLASQSCASQTSTGTSEMPVSYSTRPVSQLTPSQSQHATGKSEMPRLQSTGPVSHITASHTPTGKNVLPSASVAAAQQDPDSEQQTDPTSPVGPME